VATRSSRGDQRDEEEEVVVSEEAIQAVMDQYSAAVGAKDVDAFVALYDPDVRVFDMWGTWSYEGADPWRQMATEWFGSLGDDSTEVTFTDVRFCVGDSVASTHSQVTYRGVSPSGEELRSMDNRITWVLRGEPGGSWLIVHEHSSAPADFDTAKVMLKR
jgi:uncharacterized protein (TIGR02246 family)